MSEETQDKVVLPEKHPALYFVKYLILKDPSITDPEIFKTLSDWSFLMPGPGFLPHVRNDLMPPANFNPLDRLNRESMKFLRKEGVYELFYPNAAVEEAWSILADPQMRATVEQVLLSQMPLNIAALKVNKRTDWKLTVDGITAYGKFFWNVKLMSLDEWGRFLWGRTAMYERHMALLQAATSGQYQLAMFHLRLDQVVESKHMIQRAQQICYFNLEEVNQRPGTGADKIKAITVLTKAINECHNTLSTSDMALKDILKNFERFRMEHPLKPAPDIHQLAPGGNFTGSGVKDDDKNKAH